MRRAPNTSVVNSQWTSEQGILTHSGASGLILIVEVAKASNSWIRKGSWFIIFSLSPLV